MDYGHYAHAIKILDQQRPCSLYGSSTVDRVNINIANASTNRICSHSLTIVTQLISLKLKSGKGILF